MLITLSGPQGQIKSAQQALTKAGFEVKADATGNADQFDWGFGSSDNGNPVVYLTAAGEDADAANEAVAEMGWRVRAQHVPIELVDPEPRTPLEKLGRMGLSVADLKALLAGDN